MSAMRADALGGGGSRPESDAAGVVIAPMRRRHLRSVIRIEAHAEHRGWSVGLYLSELRRERDRLYVVARTANQVTGFAGLLLQGEDAHVTTIAVDPTRRGERIGTRLVLVLARHAIVMGAQHLTLEVRASNEPAIRLYRRFGLAPAGIRKNYYADLGEDALIMWVHDIDTPAYADRLAGIEAGLGVPTHVEGVRT